MDLSLYDQLQNPVLVVDKDLRVVYFNHICGTYFKAPPRKLRQTETLNELIQTDKEDFSKLVKEVLKERASKVTEEISIKAGPNQLEAAVILKFIPLNGERVAAHLLDFSIEKQLHEKYKKQILELKETHEQIVRSDKLTALGELIAGISHEIATPLTIVSDRLGRMEEALITKDLAGLDETLSEVQKEFLRITQIISGMQSYARNQEDELQICNLKEIVGQSRDFIRELGILGSIKLEVEASDEHLAMANPLKLQQVVINLIKNSVDALKNHDSENKEILVRIEENDSEQIHKIRVIDNGPGIPAEDAGKIFEMFYTSKEIGEGTGLGLSISQKIAQAHNGEIQLAKSEGGAEFVVNLPIVEVGSFTHTNRYLRGECEIEDEKVLIIGDDIGLLNKIYQKLKTKNKVCVFSSKVDHVQSLADFFVIDKAIKLKSCDLSFLDTEVVDLVEVSEEEILKEIEAKV